MDATWQLIAALATELEAARINHTFWGDTALFIHGVEMPELPEVTVNVQWDQFPDAQHLFASHNISPVDKDSKAASFTFERGGMPVRIVCHFNTVIATDPERVVVLHHGQVLHAKSLEHYRRTLPSDDPRVERINTYLRAKQRENSRINQAAWNQSTYDAWVYRYGTPNEAAERIQKDPASRLSPLNRYLGDVSGKKVVNLLGSHGSKAVALALLGADATVVDISAENAAYATELAEAAGVSIRYVVSDVLELPEAELTADYDIVLMELGILHYFIDLQPLARVILGLLRTGGRLVLHDFHPVSTKLITSKGKKHKVTGNYFDTSLQETDVAYSKHFPDGSESLQKVLLRKWTLGEVVTALAGAGLFIRLLEEEPNTKLDDMGLPKTFTIVAEKQ